MNTLKISCLSLLLLVSTACVSQAQYRDAPQRVDKDLILELVNEARTEGCRCDGERMPPVAPLTWNRKLENAAQGHSDWMDRTGRFSHRGRRGSRSGDRATDAGYIWSSVGENIAAGQVSEEDVVAGWLKSPGHCKNIMNGSFTHMGVATKGPYWTQVFGKPRRGR